MKQIIVTGRLGQDPEVSETKNSKTMVRLFIIEDERRFDQQSGQWETINHLFSFTLFGHHATYAAKYAKQGNNVLLVGEARYNEWSDKETGEKRTGVNFVVAGNSSQFVNYGNPVKDQPNNDRADPPAQPDDGSEVPF